MRPSRATLPSAPPAARPSAGARARAALVLAAAFALAAPAAPRAEDFLDQYAATDRFRAGAPRNMAVTPGGGEVLFLRSGPRDRIGALWAYDTRTRTERRLLDAPTLLAGAAETLTVEARARLERLRSSARGIASFALSRDGKRILVPLSGRLFVAERASGAVRELKSDAGAAEDARFSPDGARVACVREGDLWVADVAGGAWRRLTTHDDPHTGWGSPEFVAQEEMDRYEGWWWSPDSRRIAVQWTDERKVERLRIADPFRPEQPPTEFAYPRPGRENADVRLAVVSVEGGDPKWVEWDRARWPYLCRVTWPERGPLTLLVMDRVQREEAVLAADPDAGTTRVLFIERDPVWLNLPEGAPRWLADGKRWLWIAERDDSGPWLERRDAAGGAPVRLTPPGLRVKSLVAVDEPRGAAWVIASDDPRESHLWRVPLAGGAPKRAAMDAGLETAVFAEDGAARVRSLRPAAGEPRWFVEDAAGRSLGELRSLAEAPVLTPNVEYVNVGPDSLRACLVRPRDFDPSRRYPVLEFAYGGPHSLQVERRRSGFALDQWLADHGFVVVRIDGRGTPGRGRTWERAIRGDLIGPALADHVAGLRALCASRPWLDPERIGVYGWSFGGYYAVLAAERAPETYRAAVAGAPVGDWRDYDTFYTERYLGLPGPDSAAYARSSALTDAAKLTRPLLVIHGTADDNVYFFNTLKLADALDRAGREWSLLPLPGQTHAVNDPAMQRQEWERTAAFFRRTLGGPSDGAPPRP